MIRDRYFDAGQFFGDTAHVMSLTFEELAVYLNQAHRLIGQRNRAARQR